MSRGKLIALLMCVSSIAAAIAGGHAYFTSQAKNRDNYVRAGTVELSLDPTSAAFNVAALAPGATASSTIRVANDGTLPVDYRVSSKKEAGITAFYEALSAKVEDGRTGKLLFQGPLSSMEATATGLAVGASQDLKFTLGLPLEVGDSMQGDYAKITFQFDSEQVH